MKKLLLFTMMLGIVLCAACRPGHQIQTFSSSTSTYSQNALSSDDVKKAIVTACATRGWHATELSPGNIEARIIVRNKHTVIVDIPYSAEKYAIKYKSSTNMEYSSGSQKIHPNYNKWVNVLHNEINLQLAKARKS